MTAPAARSWNDQAREALRANGYRPATHDGILAALLPLVAQARTEAAAEALEQAARAYESDAEQPHINHLADTVYRPGDCLSSIWLRARAAAVRATSTGTGERK